MVKVISLSDEAYERLKSLKAGRSFSEVVIDLSALKPRGKVMEFCGIWGNDKGYWEKYKKEIAKNRKRFKLREVKF